ncbi:MAG TPA: SpoIIE family protein phosphatase [Marmoricola sp.]|nr:SpoIIE family protein phosphatase [Marmoricola sp.]
MRAFLEASGQLGDDLLAVDWASTPLGDPDEWPPALRNSVRILLTSRFSMWMAWGPELTFFCNEAYRRDTLGKKYPWALGRPASEVWSEIWPDIGPRIDRVTSTGEATWDESLLLFLERSGYVEETYHTFSYSPLADDDNRVAGMLCVVKEDTEQVIATRRMSTLRDLGIRLSDLDETETVATACERLAENPWSLPFTLVYLFDAEGRTAARAGMTGFEGTHPAAPAVIAVDDADPAWPAAVARAGGTVVLEDIGERFPALPRGAWQDPPRDAVVVPLAQPGQLAPYGVLVVGLNPYRPADEAYQAFLTLIAGHLATALTDARAFEFEKQRAESLARIDQAKTDFFTNVSHELRTPLTLILGPVEDALADADDPLSPGQRERLEVVLRSSQRLLKLVNSLLDFSRLESGGLPARYEQLDLAAYTTELASMFQAAAGRAGLTLTVDCRPLAERPYVDREQWAKVVLNLVSNAFKFTFEGGVAVRLSEEDGAAVLTVCDTGIGIPDHELPQLFNRFHRVHGAPSRTHEGSGIGLALVAELVSLHGGTVTASSAPDEGTTFTVRIPLGSDHLPADQVNAETVVAEPTGGVAHHAQGFVSETLRWISDEAVLRHQHPAALTAGREKAGRVLVVDDNTDMREYVASLLSGEYDVDTAADGLEALERVVESCPDLVLTDVMMPRLDGFGLLERLQSDPATVGVPVIMLSARAGEDGTVEGLEAGADDYLVKPFSARELLARVRVNLELDRTRRVQDTLESSKRLLDQAQRLAKVGSWEVDLAADTVVASEELLRLLERTPAEIDRLGFEGFLGTIVHPDDREIVRESLEGAVDDRVLSYEARVVLPSGQERLVTVHGEVVASEDGAPQLLRGSVQDVTEQRRAELVLARAAGLEEAAAREHSIADQLQRSLLPQRTFDVEHLDVATYYRAGVQGTQVGGDWYDIIELGAGRTAFVIGDVMGRGVSAAVGMGQLRSAVRALAKLDLPPAEVLEYLDGIVQDLPGDQIVTCVYAVFDSTDQSLRYASAGHLPALLVSTDGASERLDAAGPPLGAGYFGMATEHVRLDLGSTVTFYTDGLVERRDRDIDLGIEALEELLGKHASAPLEQVPEVVVAALLPDGPEDDIAILMTRVNAERFESAVTHRITGDITAVGEARRVVAGHLLEWELPEEVVDEVVLMTSELVTNAFVHGRPPLDLRLRRTATEVVVEVQDRAAYRPRRRRAQEDDESGRGLQIVSVLADRWGSRATGRGKSVWFSVTLGKG